MINFFKFILSDIKKDVEFIKKCVDGEINFIRRFKSKMDEFKKLSPTEIIKHNWMMFLVIILAFVTGYFIASVIAQNACNEILFNISYAATRPDFYI